MKTEKFVWGAILLAIVAVAYFQPTLNTSVAVQVPDALKLAIDGILLAAVTLGLQALFDRFGLDLRGSGTAIAVALSAFAIGELQGIINIIPQAYDAVTMIVLNILVVILAGVGTIRAVFHPERAAELLAPQ